MRSIFILTILLIGIIAGAFYYVCYTPALILKKIPGLCETYLKDGKLRSVEVSGQSLVYPNTLKLHKVNAEVEWKGEVYQLQIKSFAVSDIWEILKYKNRALVKIEGMNLQRKNLEVRDAALEVHVQLDAQSLKNIEGVVRLGEVNVNPYIVTNVHARIARDQDVLKVSELSMQSYGGSAKGEAKITYAPKLTHSLVVEFSGVQSQQLQSLNKYIFSQLQGVFDGTLRVSALDNQLQILALWAQMPKGGTLRQSLAEKIASYMTDEVQRYHVATLFEDRPEIALDSAEFRILNINQNLAGVTVTLGHKKSDLRINETINIDIDRILQKIAWKF